MVIRIIVKIILILIFLVLSISSLLEKDTIKVLKFQKSPFKIIELWDTVQDIFQNDGVNIYLGRKISRNLVL